MDRASCIDRMRGSDEHHQFYGWGEWNHGGIFVGGACSAAVDEPEDPVYGEDSISSRREKNKEEKECIAKKARAQIEDGDTILLDSGTTALDLAELLKDIHNLTVITNDLQIALKLQKYSEIHLILLGGRVRTSFECTVGGMGIRALEELSVDKVFMTTNALSLQKGATTPNLDNAEIKDIYSVIAVRLERKQFVHLPRLKSLM